MQSLVRISLIVLPMTISTLVIAQPRPTLSDPNEPNSTPTFSTEGVWHKNMELISQSKSGPISAGEHFQAISIGSNHYVVQPRGAAGGIPSCLELWDVTDPRDISLAVRISGFEKRWSAGDPANRVQSTNALRIHAGDVWKDNSTGHTLSGHVFAVFDVTVLQGTVTLKNFVTQRDDNVLARENSKLSRFIVFDLTEALAFVAGQSTKHIIIDDATVRNSAHREASGTMTHKVYIGTIPIPQNDFAGNVHTVDMERRQGVFVVSPLSPLEIPGTTRWAGFVDLYLLNKLASHADVNSTTAFMLPNRLEVSGKPIECITDMSVPESLRAVVSPHETHVHTPRVLSGGHLTDVFETRKLLLTIADYENQ